MKRIAIKDNSIELKNSKLDEEVIIEGFESQDDLLQTVAYLVTGRNT